MLKAFVYIDSIIQSIMFLPFVFSSGISFSSALTGPKFGNFTAVRGFSFFKFGAFSGSPTVVDFRAEVGTGPRMNSMSRLLKKSAICKKCYCQFFYLFTYFSIGSLIFCKNQQNLFSFFCLCTILQTFFLLMCLSVLVSVYLFV